MEITVLLFGISAELVGTSSLSFSLQEGATVRNFSDDFCKVYPQLTHFNSYAIAVNESYAGPDILLKANDVVAIIPPVSGG